MGGNLVHLENQDMRVVWTCRGGRAETRLHVWASLVVVVGVASARIVVRKGA